MYRSRTALAWCLPIAATIFLVSPLTASGRKVVPLDERIKGSEQVIVARAERIDPTWTQNERGDRLIVSRVLLRVEETLKGTSESATWMEVEGGTLGGLTLHVSDLDDLEVGDRAVFMLDRPAAGLRKPHLRGQGILKLNDNNVVVGSNVRLDDVRRNAASGGN